MIARKIGRWPSVTMLLICLVLVKPTLALSQSAASSNPSDDLVNQASTVAAYTIDASLLPSVSSQAADDFVVPSNVFWHINHASVVGNNVGTTGPGIDRILVQFYTDSGAGLPSKLIYSQIIASSGYSITSIGTYNFNLNPQLVLGPGHYWFSMQPHVISCPDNSCRQWLWIESLESPGPNQAESAWQGSWVSDCKTWQLRVTVCGRPSTSTGKDLAFQLQGVTVPVVAQINLPLISR